MAVSALRGLFLERNYAIYTAGNTLSLIGTWIHRIALGWFVWELTRSPFWVGVYAASGIIPILFTGLIGGVLADILDRRRLALWSQVAACGLMLVLFAFYQLELLTLATLLVFRVLLAGVISISQPARMALLPSLVSPAQVVAAVSFGAVVFNVARLAGPALAALILAKGGFGAAFLANAVSYLAMIIALLLVNIDPARLPKARQRTATMTGDIAAGVRYVIRHDGMLPIFVLFVVVVLLARPVSALLPAFVELSFSMGVEGFAILTSSMAVGSILGGVWATGRVLRGLTSATILAAVGYALCVALFSAATSFIVAAFLLGLAGFFTVLFGASAQALIQSAVEEDYRGRVLGLWFVTMRAAPELGALLLGIAAEVIGLSLSFIGSAVCCLLVCWWVWQRRVTLSAALEGGAPQILKVRTDTA
ncbi:MAG: MFS transporter [Gammaproteobacteria bacterium]|nr:MFS transporter [Gammaproteobacteria bacterium]